MKNTTDILMLILVIMALTASAFAADLERMRTNIRVQEKIIDTLMGSESDFGLSPTSEGIYIPGFGAVFSISVSDDSEIYTHRLLLDLPEPPFITFETGRTPSRSRDRAIAEFEEERSEIEEKAEEYEREIAELEEPLRDNIAKMEKRAKELEKYSMELEKKETERLAELQKKFDQKKMDFNNLLIDYIIDYGPTLGLPENETIMLRGVFETYLQIDKSDYSFEITASGKDLEKAKKGLISRSALEKKIEIKDLTESNGIPTDVAIMKNIIKTAFDTKKKGRYIIWSGSSVENSWGSYVDGFGAVFYHRYHQEPTIMSLSTHYGDTGGDLDIIVSGGSDEKSEEDRKELELKIEADITDLLVTYTPTLKSVKSDENIVVAVKLGDYDRGNKNSMMIFNVKKDEIGKQKIGGKENKINVVIY